MDAGLHFVGDDVIFDGQLHVFAGGGGDLPLQFVGQKLCGKAEGQFDVQAASTFFQRGEGFFAADGALGAGNGNGFNQMTHVVLLSGV